MKELDIQCAANLTRNKVKHRLARMPVNFAQQVRTWKLTKGLTSKDGETYSLLHLELDTNDTEAWRKAWTKETPASPSNQSIDPLAAEQALIDQWFIDNGSTC